MKEHKSFLVDSAAHQYLVENGCNISFNHERLAFIKGETTIEL